MKSINCGKQSGLCSILCSSGLDTATVVSSTTLKRMSGCQYDLAMDTGTCSSKQILCIAQRRNGMVLPLRSISTLHTGAKVYYWLSRIAPVRFERGMCAWSSRDPSALLIRSTLPPPPLPTSLFLDSPLLRFSPSLILSFHPA